MKLELRGVSKLFDGGPTPVHALRDIDLTVDQGEYVVITGPSGSGKSTLLLSSAVWKSLCRYVQSRRRRCGCAKRHPAVQDAGADVWVRVPGVSPAARQNRPRQRHAADDVRNVAKAYGAGSGRFSCWSGSAWTAGAVSAHAAVRRRAAARRHCPSAGQNDPAVILADEPTGELDSVHREIDPHAFGTALD